MTTRIGQVLDYVLQASYNSKEEYTMNDSSTEMGWTYTGQYAVVASAIHEAKQRLLHASTPKGMVAMLHEGSLDWALADALCIVHQTEDGLHRLCIPTRNNNPQPTEWMHFLTEELDPRQWAEVKVLLRSYLPVAWTVLFWYHYFRLQTILTRTFEAALEHLHESPGFDLQRFHQLGMDRAIVGKLEQYYPEFTSYLKLNYPHAIQDRELVPAWVINGMHGHLARYRNHRLRGSTLVHLPAEQYPLMPELSHFVQFYGDWKLKMEPDERPRCDPKSLANDCMNEITKDNYNKYLLTEALVSESN